MTRPLHRKTNLDGVRPSMNVTPLVDVVLVLLIIFMVVAPQLNQEVQVDLPGIFNIDPESSTDEPFTVTMAEPGVFHYNGQRWGSDGLVNELQAAHAVEPLRRLVLRADSKLRYGDVRSIQNRLREVGFPGLSFMVTEKHRWEEGQQG